MGKSGRYRVNNINLHVIEEGDESHEKIVFLHGFPEFWYAWKNQIPFFAAKGFHVLAPDLRGYNLSSKPSGVKSYTVENGVSDIKDLICLKSTSPVNVVGHDWGGLVAWMLAIEYPELVKKLIVVNPT